MDFGIRELLMFFGALIFIGVLADGVRRYQQNRRKQLKVKVVHKKTPEKSEEESIDWYAGELPGGSARVKSNYSSENNQNLGSDGIGSDGIGSDDIDEDDISSEHITFSKTARGSNGRQAPTFSEPLDILMDDDEAGYTNNENITKDVSSIPQEDIPHENNSHTAHLNQISDNAENSSNQYDGHDDGHKISEPHSEQYSGQKAEQESVISSEEELVDDKNQGDLFGGSSEQSKPTRRQEKASLKAEKSDALNEGRNSKYKRKPTSKVNAEAESKTENVLPEVVLSVNVIAKDGEELNGARLLELVSSFGLRFGDMDIFHRHEHSTGQGPVIFSMASAVNPGTFNVSELESSSIKGVTFFMRLSELNKRTSVLELMVDIAKRLANQLGAELKDDTHSVLSSQTVTHYKSRIQEYERRHLGQILGK